MQTIFVQSPPPTGTFIQNRPPPMTLVLAKNIILIWNYFNANEIKWQFS